MEIVPEQAARSPAVEAETELHASLPHHKGTLLVPAHPAAKSLPPSTDKSCVLLPPSAWHDAASALSGGWWLVVVVLVVASGWHLLISLLNEF